MARNPDFGDKAYVQSQQPPAGDASQPVSHAVRPASHATSSGGGRSGGGGGGTVSFAAPTIDQATLAQQYGFTVSFLKAYPEINALFQKAVAGGWSPDKFTGALKSTQWYQNFSDAQRKALVLQYTDPATYNQNLNSATIHIRDLASQLGVDPNDSGTINAVATKYLQEGWNDEQARNELGMHLNFGNGNLIGGEAGKEVDSLNQYMYQMGVKNSDDWLRQNVIGIVRGQKQEQDVMNDIMSQAIAAFPQYEQQIRGGMTVESLAQPYVQSMEKILEIPSGQVNLFDPTIRNVMSYKDPTGNAQAKPLWQFQNDLRQDPRWGKTQNAQDAAMGAAHSILKDFGFYS